MLDWEASACDLCGSFDEEVLLEKPGALTGRPFPLVRCRRCGLLYLNPRLTQASLADLYDCDYYHGRGFDSHVRYAQDFDKDSDEEKLFRPALTIQAVRELCPPPAHLLDYGCGLGDLVREATKAGYSAQGYDVSAYARGFAMAHGLAVYDTERAIPRQHYDVVTAVEVLEHCYSPRRVLETIANCLKPGGAFYYTTGNFHGFYEAWKKHQPHPMEGYVVPEGHVHFFTPQTMMRYFRLVGLVPVLPRYGAPTAYDRTSRLFRAMVSLGLTSESADAPHHVWEKVAYWGGRRTIFFVRSIGLGHPSLPLARKPTR